MAAVVAANLGDRGGRLVRVAHGERAFAGGEGLLESRGLEYDGTPGGQVARRAVAEPAASRPHVSALGARELAQRPGDVVAIGVRTSHLPRILEAPAVALEQFPVGVVVLDGERQLERLVRPAREIHEPGELLHLIVLSPSARDRVATMIERHVAKQAASSATELRRNGALLAELKEQERKLLAKHYQDAISEGLFSEEAARIKGERAEAEAILAWLTIRHDEPSDFIALVLKLASYDLHSLYLRATPHIRRLMNQAIFEAIWVWDEDEIRSNLGSPLKEVLAIDKETTEAIDRIQGHARARLCPGYPGRPWVARKEEASDPWKESEDFALGVISESMVGAAGFEPATSRV
jgi:hypothetical protein